MISNMKHVKDIKQKISRIKNLYKLEFSHFIDLPEDLFVHDIDFNDGILYLSGLDKNNKTTGQIISINLKDNSQKIVVENIKANSNPIRLSMRCIPEKLIIIFSEAESQLSNILKIVNLQNNKCTFFAKDSNHKLLQSLSIKIIGDFVFAVDFLGHNIIKYSLDGKLLNIKQFSNYGLEFPLQVEVCDKSNIYIFFNQDSGNLSFKKFSSINSLNQSFFIKWNHVKDEISFLTPNDISQDKFVMSFIRTQHNDFFLIKEDVLFKYDALLNKVFEINIGEFFIKKLNIALSYFQVNRTHRKFICTCSDSNLFITSTTTGFLRKIAVFNI